MTMPREDALMSPRFAVPSLVLLLGFPAAQPLPSGPPIPVPIIDQCGCPPDASGAPSDTCPSGPLEFKWHAEPNAVIRWEYRLDNERFPALSFVSVPPGKRNVSFPPGSLSIPPGAPPNRFTLRAIGPKSVRETQCSVPPVGFPPDTWLSGPDPSSPSLSTKPNGERYALLVNGRLEAPIVGSQLSDDSVNVLPAARAQRRTFFEIWKDTVFVRFDGDTVHMNSWVLLHSGGSDKDSPYSVDVTDAARLLPGFPGGPVLTPGPPNGSPVAFRSQLLTVLSPTGVIAVAAISNPYPIFDPNDVFNNPHIGSYSPVIQSGPAYLYAFAVDGDNMQDRRIGLGTPGSIDPITLVREVENGTATPYEAGLRTKVLSFYVDRPPLFVIGSPLFRPRPDETFTSATWNLKLVAYDEDPYRFGSAPGGPSSLGTLTRRIQVHGHDLQGNDLTYVDPTVHFQEDVALSVPANLAPGPCTVEVQLCDCDLCEDFPGTGRCVSQSFPVTYAPAYPGAPAPANGARVPSITELLAPYPNPSSHGATISFRLAREGRVELELFDLAGHRVRAIESRVFPAGNHSLSWEGTDPAGRRMPAGLYVIRMRTGSFEARKKLLVVP
jgi:flagellar hook capping protein FlgD